MVERRVCTNALPALRKNSNKLIMAMCVGIALALYGIYVQSRAHSNPYYSSNLKVLYRLFYDFVGEKIMRHYDLYSICPASKSLKHVLPRLMMSYFVKPTTSYSGLANGLINVLQILLLKLYYGNIPVTRGIMALSVVGLSVSMVCMIGAVINCRLMCISCLGIHHLFIIYFALRRIQILSTGVCPSMGAINEGTPCAGGSPGGAPGNGGAGKKSPYKTGGMIFGNASAIPRSTSKLAEGSSKRRTSTRSN